MTNIVPNPHDRFFKAAMSNPQVALEFFETHLPEAIQKRADLKTLQIQPGTFVDEELQLQVTDMLFSVDWAGQPGYLYSLIEHQRTPDQWMAFRKLKYVIQIMEQHRKKTGELPLVYVLIVYNGEQKYRYATDLFDLFGEHKDLARQTFLEPFHLIDLSQIPDENLKHQAWLGILQMCLKHAYARDVLPLIQNIVDLMQAVEQGGGIDYIKTVFHYLFATGEVSDAQALVQTIHHHLSPQLEETIMTFAQQLRSEGLQEGLQKGRQEGIQEGLEKGVQKGRQEAMRELAIHLLQSNKLSPQEIADATGLPKEIVLDLLASSNKAY